MAFNSDFTNYLTKRLAALSLSDKKPTGLNFQSVSQLTDSLSIFETSGQNIADMDFAAIAQALNTGDLTGIESEGTQSIAAMMSEILSVNGVSDNTDIMADETIDEAEIEAFIKELAEGDGDATNLTLQDIDALFEKMGIDLDKAAEDAVNEIVEEIAAQLEEELKEKELEEEKEAEKAQEAQQAQSSSPASSSGGSYNSGNVGSAAKSSAANKATKTEETDAETAEEIKTKISEKEEEITEVEDDAEAQIEEQEEAKKEAMENAGVTEKEYEEYKKQAEEKEEAIKEKEEAITAKDDEISDYNSTISSNENYIGSLDAQISENQSLMNSISDDDKNADSKRADASAKIANLEAEKTKVEEENKNLETKIKEAEEAKETLKEEKEKLEEEKKALLEKTLDDSKGFGKGMTGTERKDAKSAIMEYDNKISEIKADKETKVASIKEEIQTLEVKLKDAEALEKRAEVIKDNAFTNGLGLTGEELVEVAKQMLNKYGSTTGLCATGVSRTFQMAYGISMGGNGCDWDSNMEKLVEQGAFIEVTSDYATSAELANLPAGAVVCWENTGVKDGSGGEYGHVCIADGNGGEISDHYQASIYKSVGGRSDQYRIFIPV